MLYQPIYPRESVVNGTLFRLEGIPTIILDKDSINAEEYDDSLPTEARYLIQALNRYSNTHEWVPLKEYQAGADEANIVLRKVKLYYELKTELGKLL